MNSGNMGKLSKDAQQSSDDKNSMTKRLKGTNSQHKNAEISVKQSDVSRSKSAAAVSKKNKSVILTKTGDGVKLTKLKSPVKIKTTSPIRPVQQTLHRSEKILSVLSEKKNTMKVQSSGNMEMMSSSQSKKKDPTKVKNKNEVRTPSVEIIEIPLETNGKSVELQQVPEIKNQKEKNEKEISVEKETNNINLEQQKNGTKPEIEESNEIKLVLEDNVITESSENLKNDEDEVISLSSTISISEISQSNDIVESTSSELIKKSPEKEKEKIEQEQTNDVVITEDPSFVSYNTSIMLKDVKIKLNDCLRENTKLMESVDENTSISAAFKDLSFGRTLRTISGRSSLGRLRHVTLRKQQMTPNDSLFVNCSGMSGNQDDSINRFASEFPDSFFNGSRTGGLKRKIETDIEPSAKKIKQEKQEIGGFFNTSVEYIKNLRRPVRVSTPISSQGYKFDVDDKFNITEDASRIEIDEPTEPKSWCLLM